MTISLQDAAAEVARKEKKLNAARDILKQEKIRTSSAAADVRAASNDVAGAQQTRTQVIADHDAKVARAQGVLATKSDVLKQQRDKEASAAGQIGQAEVELTLARDVVASL